VLFAERVKNTGIKTTYQVKPIYNAIDWGVIVDHHTYTIPPCSFLTAVRSLVREEGGVRVNRWEEGEVYVREGVVGLFGRFREN